MTCASRAGSSTGNRVSHFARATSLAKAHPPARQRLYEWFQSDNCALAPHCAYSANREDERNYQTRYRFQLIGGCARQQNCGCRGPRPEFVCLRTLRPRIAPSRLAYFSICPWLSSWKTEHRMAALQDSCPRLMEKGPRSEHGPARTNGQLRKNNYLSFHA